MTATTFEEAKVCPKCHKPGVDRKAMVAANMAKGTTVHSIYCVTEGCKWFNTPWMVQVNPDGSIPAPTDHRGEAKTYVGFEQHDQLAAQIRLALERDIEAQHRGDEIRRRQS